MKKIIMVCIALLLALSMAACTKQEDSVENEEVKQEAASGSEQSQEAKDSSEDGKEGERKTLENYKKLIGLSREEIIDAMGEEPSVIDEGGLEFSKASIRVWFIEDGKTVDQIFIDDSDVDFNGARLGGNIEDFKNIFGEPVMEDHESAYSNFDYEGLVLHVTYDKSTGKVFAVYLMKEWK
ncbi:hypothetical protein SAMN02745945_02089 [Peptoclostridium litorale DSM 5388]|uniref:DUF4309 domain-containing protein n=1 Tax=Peptoclostridium litorale DSM 5388 TaxID=1121324 RepID=A0A069REJ9_PEPLI|nr:hypothetical protein [Peptoclostridium litorale]KDR95466.1 hypothetical protein CLIT_10c01930 [Peptoclostridium litorale DSM 5388]SIO18108.1 hypothetical protein SAMN02745945_02089 [Peptoclostridium litorale DSM 5388]